MALTIETKTVRGVEQDAIIVSASPELVILTQALTSFDTKQLTAASELIDGNAINDLNEALPEYVMPNGQTADVYYGMYILDVEAVNASYVPTGAAFNRMVVSRLDALEDKVADLEITVGGG